MSGTNGHEYTSRHPGWLQNEFFDKISDEEFRKLFGFYVINTPIVSRSYRGIYVTTYRWDKGILGKHEFKEFLFKIAGLKRNETFATAETLSMMKSAFEKTDLKKGFNKSRDCERIAIYKAKCNEVTSIFDHIRNAFAHGRFALYDCGEDDVFVLEDVKPNRDSSKEVEVRARMVLKKSTLLKWVDIIEAGPTSEEYQQYQQLKQKGKKENKKAK